MSGTIGFSAKVEADTGASSAYEVIGKASMITVPSLEMGSIETTYISQSNRAKTFIPGLYDHGSLSVECLYEAATYTKVHALAVAGTVQNWKITAPSGEGQTLSFSGFVTKMEASFETESLSKIKYEVKVSGVVTLA